MIITIAGEIGTGGEEVADLLAEELGYKKLSKDIISRAAELAGFNTQEAEAGYIDEDEDLSDNGQRYSSALLRLQLDTLPIQYVENAEQVQYDADKTRFAAANQKALIEAANEGNCLIMGRCACYYLAGRPDVLRILTIDSKEGCRKRVNLNFGLTDIDKIDALIAKTNKRRADYLKYYTGRDLLDTSLYDFVINVGYLGEKGTAELIRQIIEDREKAVK